MAGFGSLLPPIGPSANIQSDRSSTTTLNLILVCRSASQYGGKCTLADGCPAVVGANGTDLSEKHPNRTTGLI